MSPPTSQSPSQSSKTLASPSTPQSGIHHVQSNLPLETCHNPVAFFFPISTLTPTPKQPLSSGVSSSSLPLWNPFLTPHSHLPADRVNLPKRSSDHITLVLDPLELTLGEIQAHSQSRKPVFTRHSCVLWPPSCPSSCLQLLGYCHVELFSTPKIRYSFSSREALLSTWKILFLPFHLSIEAENICP